MIKFIKKLFKKKVQAKVIPLYEQPSFENVENFLNSPDINEVTESRSTSYFKEASSILDSNPVLEDSEQLEAMQSFISKNDEEKENIDINIIPEEETVLFRRS